MNREPHGILFDSVPEDAEGCPYVCSQVFYKGQWYLLGTCWSDRISDRISDPVRISF